MLVLVSVQFSFHFPLYPKTAQHLHKNILNVYHQQTKQSLVICLYWSVWSVFVCLTRNNVINYSSLISLSQRYQNKSFRPTFNLCFSWQFHCVSWWLHALSCYIFVLLCISTCISSQSYVIILETCSLVYWCVPVWMFVLLSIFNSLVHFHFSTSPSESAQQQAFIQLMLFLTITVWFEQKNQLFASRTKGSVEEWGQMSIAFFFLSLSKKYIIS